VNHNVLSKEQGVKITVKKAQNTEIAE